jgi:endothelin-converting enzyme/putative endopeptidase
LKTTLILFLCAFALFAQPNASMIRFDVKALDTKAEPCTDFFQYACGNWIKNNPIPADQARWARFNELDERNKVALRQILEEAGKAAANRDADTQKIGDYYAACMDDKALDAKGLAPLQPELDRIANLKDKSQLAALLARLHRIGIPTLFEFGSGQDFKDSTKVVAQLDQGGLGLPDRDYYLKEDARSADIRAKYVAHVQRMFELAGEKHDEAKAHAQTVMRIETELAKGSLDRVSRRDPEKIYHPMTKSQAAALAPAFQFTRYFTDAGAPRFDDIVVASPEFFKTVNAQIESLPLEDWKVYLKWHTLHSEVPVLPNTFLNENFNFYGKILQGIQEMRPRWKRCVDYTDRQLGEALGKKYVEKTFGAESKERMLKMVRAIETAMGQDIERLPWMSAATKKEAMIKLRAVTNKIGYPDKFRDYSALEIKPGDAMGNGFRADAFEFQRQLDKIGKPVDRTEWLDTPPTVNAYYDPQMNNINFPAGILQPPFFDPTMDDAVNFGAIGAVIGHELTHGFDDEGRQFDPAGNLRDWWTAADANEFKQRAACVDDEYSSFQVAPGAHINGKLTLGENTADNGGARIALMALLNTIGTNGKKIDGFTPEQRFFLAYGQVWCANSREEALRLQVQTDPHSPPQFRVNGVVQNMPEFQKAFSCKAGQPMVKANACRVW